jgi:hypothetical protein
MSTPSDGRPARKPNPRTMRLPGSVAEAQASPPGPEIGAFFDLDGTLVAGFTGVLLTQDTFRRREIGPVTTQQRITLNRAPQSFLLPSRLNSC